MCLLLPKSPVLGKVELPRPAMSKRDSVHLRALRRGYEDRRAADGICDPASFA